MKIKIAVRCGVLGSLFLATTMSAAVYVVDNADGIDSASGGDATPFKTIQAAVDRLTPGDTVLIRSGVYRERIVVTAQGTEAKPIVIKAADGVMPVVSGADRITSWKPIASAAEAAGNKLYSKIYYADIEWEPTALFEEGKRQGVAQTPNDGWWPAKNATATTITDTDNLKGSSWAVDGATLFFFRHKGFAFSRRPIASADRDAGTVTLSEPLTGASTTADRYRFENHVAYIDQPGEWSFRKLSDDRFRIFYMPRGADILRSMIEIPRRDKIMDLGATAHCVVQGLEITMSAAQGKVPGAGIGNEVSKQQVGAGESISILSCKIQYNGRFGFYGRGYKKCIFKNNLVRGNGHGVLITGTTGCLIENNEIMENDVDGLIISHGSKDVVVKNNYIHHHNLYGHPDNVQFYNGVENILLEGNYILCSGQSAMMQEAEGVVFRNNVVAGAEANMIIMGHGNANNGVWERNTFALWTSALFSFTGKDYKLANNIMMNSGGTLFYGIPEKGEFSSSENLLYRAPESKYGFIANRANDGGKRQWLKTLLELQSASTQEKGSVFQDPEFKNTPAFITTLNVQKIGECTRERLHYSMKNVSEIAAGDLVEIHFDGVKRQVVSSTAGEIVIKPPLDKVPDRILFVSNWRKNSNFVLDFSSPYNKSFGSTINTVNYAKGDFDGDGKRDIPAY